MNIVVFLAGIADPKWPLQPMTVADNGQAITSGDTKSILSPFDEAALEIALKIRDADSGARICIVVPGNSDGDNLIRTVAGFRPDQLFRISPTTLHMWDASLFGIELASAAADALAEADLILMGREFGDFDNGTLAPCMAEQMQRQFFGLIQDARVTDSKLQLMREKGPFEEWITPASSVFASVTNDRRNRLRHPLMKNVMAAKRMVFPAITPTNSGVAGQISLASVMAEEPSDRTRTCRILTGSLESQARELAEFLKQWKEQQ